MRLTARTGVDLGVLATLSLIGIAGLATSFHDLGWLLAGVGGLAVGTGAALAARALRLGALLTVGLALVAYLLFGSALAVPGQAFGHLIPTVSSIASLGVGAVWGWADLVTLRPPVKLPEYVTVVPYVSAWFVGVVGTTLATRWLPRRRSAPRAALLLLGPGLLYLASILLGTDQPYFPGLRGVAFAALALIWLGSRPSEVRRLSVEGPRGRSGGMLGPRLAGAAVVVGAAAVIGAVSGTALSPGASDRFVLRDKIVPPFQPLEFASPLAGFRHYSKLEADDTLFTVRGLKPEQRLRLATMDSYDGHLWTVAGSTIASEGSGSFALVGSSYPKPVLATAAGSQTLSVVVEDYNDVWVPSVGYPISLRLLGASTDDLTGLRYNAATGSAVVLGGLAQGARVTLTAELQKTDYDDDALRDVPTARVQLGPVDDAPDIVAAKATEFAGSTTSPIEQLRNIEQTLHTQGFLSHGTASDAVPSLAGHGADRMESLFSGSVMVGDAEQYASAMALMARCLGYPARVVMGFAPTVPDRGGAVKVIGHDVTAWVEVAFQGVGWIPFQPTPTETDVPQDQVPKPQTEPQPQVRQPPRTQNDEHDLVTTVSIDNSDEKNSSPLALPGWVVGVALGVGIPVLVVAAPPLVVAALKHRRVRRRRDEARPVDAAAGAWDELLDRLDELGIAPPLPSTRARTASELAPRLAPGAAPGALGGVAQRADAAVFSGRPLDGAELDALWDEVVTTVEATRQSLPWWKRVSSRYRLAAVASWSRDVIRLASEGGARR